MAMTLRSEVFQEGGNIPAKFTCDGDDMSPPLNWGGMPPNTGSFALIADDPDAPRGVFTHWVLFDLNANTHKLGEGVPPVPQLPDGAIQGRNSFGKIGYGGPCPPQGQPHHYVFTVYALDVMLHLTPGESKERVLAAMQRHILDQGQLIGVYQRRGR
jgi:Raf kinase inhibitor-like YbhB/YbcL family protein